MRLILRIAKTMAVVKDYEMTYKILVLGDSGVGKTCLIRRFTDDNFTDSFLSTIGKCLLLSYIFCKVG